MSKLTTESKQKEMALRIIGLCVVYGKRQLPGSGAAAHAARMLALYRRHYARLTGHEATAAMVAEVMQGREGELILCNSKRNQQPKPKQRKKCEAKVRIPCPYHDLPIPETWKPLRAKKLSDTAAAAILARKPIITDPLGNEVAFTEHLTKHWKEEKKTPKDIKNRLALLDYAMQAVKNPAEVWLHDDGTRVYLARFIDRHEQYMVAFTVKDDGSTLNSYYAREDGVNAKRKGELLFPSREGGITQTLESPHASKR